MIYITSQKIKIPSTQGNLAAVVHYPQAETEKLAILCPGFLDSKDYAHLVGLAGELSDQGYTVVRFEPTGTWESEGDTSDYTTTQYLEDVKNILEYMLQQKNYTHILLGGHSRGGKVSMLYAARDPRISVVLGIMPSSGVYEGEMREQWQRDGERISQRDVPGKESEKREYRVPFQHVLDHDQYNTLEEVMKIKVPLLLIAGESDDMVTPEDVEELFGSANEPKSFQVIPDIGHNYRHYEKEISMVNKKILEQLELLKN